MSIEGFQRSRGDWQIYVLQQVQMIGRRRCRVLYVVGRLSAWRWLTIAMHHRKPCRELLSPAPF